MAATTVTPPLIILVGETASGKTSAGIALAKQVNGEIICADSRTIYKGMDIGTAKPSKEEQAGVPHHLLNIVEPDERYSVADFQKQAKQLIDEIWVRGKFPIIVGGTGLYVDSIYFDYQFSDGVAEKDPQNLRHNKHSSVEDRKKTRPNTSILGLKLAREKLNKRIEERVEQMLKDGFLDEVNALADKYGWEYESMSGIGYRVARAYFDGDASEEEVEDAFIARDKSLAKRQRTWFKRNPHIEWFEEPGSLVKSGAKFAKKFRV